MDRTPTSAEVAIRNQRAGALAPLSPVSHAATIANLNHLVDELRSQISTKNLRIFQLTKAADQIDLHRDSVTEMEHYLRILPRWRWIRRNRIRYQLAVIAIAITKRSPARSTNT